MALNSGMACRTEGPIPLVVMLSAVWAIIKNVEVGRWEGRMAIKANETPTVVSPREAAI